MTNSSRGSWRSVSVWFAENQCQVNASPSLTADTATDYCLKMGLLEDGMAIVDIEKM
jgi:hypothetical protein